MKTEILQVKAVQSQQDTRINMNEAKQRQENVRIAGVPHGTPDDKQYLLDQLKDILKVVILIIL